MNQLAVDLGQAFGSPYGRDANFTLGGLASTAVSLGIVVAGILMVFLFIGGGFMVISGAGSNDPQTAAKGKQAVTWSVVGFFVIFIAFWVVRIIELITGNTFFTAPTF